MYDLHRLGWHSFQQLCLSISREVLGQTVQSFLDSKDGGRDGAFAGHWRPRTGEILSGSFVIQCKFSSKTDRSLRLSHLTDELEKAKRLVQKGRCDCYLLLTNFSVSGIQDEKIEKEFVDAGVKQFRCYGAEWISQQIRESSRLRMFVPRVYGIGDLSQILDERAYRQARALLDSMREDLSRVVLTGVYERAIRALDDHGFVLLLGEPACGKTTIAAMLAMAAIDQWKVSTLKLETSQQVVDHWNLEEPRQFFWVDDAFGVMQYELSLVLDWNRIFPKVRAMINAGARIVLTSRDYIYRRAKESLKESAFPLIRESQVVIDVHDITKEERKQILYNHIKLGNQPRIFRKAIKPFLEDIAAHSRFVPETARRLGTPLFTKGLVLSQSSLEEFVERQEQLLQEVIQGLDKHSQAALALIFMRNGALDSPIDLRDSEAAAVARLGSDLGETIRALTALQDSLTVMVKEEGRALWRFKHPTVGDAYGSVLLMNPELMDIYIEGAPPEKLFSTISCGDVGLKGSVVVPKGLYESVNRKLACFLDGTCAPKDAKLWRRRSTVERFLAQRCDRRFLEFYLGHRPEVLERVSNPGLYLYAVSEVDLALRLFEFNLLPESYRKKFVDAVAQYTVDGEDSYFFRNADIRKMFKEEEIESLMRRLRADLVPKLSDARFNWQSNHDSDEDPESYIEPFVEILSALEREFADDPAVRESVDRERVRVRQWVRETLSEESESRRGEDEEPDYDLGDYRHATEYETERSVFDDIDI